MSNEVETDVSKFLNFPQRFYNTRDENLLQIFYKSFTNLTAQNTVSAKGSILNTHRKSLSSLTAERRGGNPEVLLGPAGIQAAVRRGARVRRGRVLPAMPVLLRLRMLLLLLLLLMNIVIGAHRRRAQRQR